MSGCAYLSDILASSDHTPVIERDLKAGAYIVGSLILHPSRALITTTRVSPLMSPPSFKSTPSRIAIVTGAAQGLGEGIALRLAEDGLDVAIFDLPSKRGQLKAVGDAITAKGRRSLVLVGDITVEGDVVAMVAQTVEELGGLDVVSANVLSLLNHLTDFKFHR